MSLEYLRQEMGSRVAEMIPLIKEPLWGYMGDYIPTVGDLRPGEKSIPVAQIEYKGKAKLFNNSRVTDIPLVSSVITEDGFKTWKIVIGADWAQDEIDAFLEATRSNANLFPHEDPLQTNLNAVNQIIAETADQLIMYGGNGFDGFIENSRAVDDNDAVTDLYALTADELFNYLRGKINLFKREARLSSDQVTMLLPSNIYDLLTQKRALGTSVYYDLTSREQGSIIANVVEMKELDHTYLESNGVYAPGTDTDRIILYHNNPETLRRRFYPIKTTPVQTHPNGMVYMMSAYYGSSEVMLRQPLRMRYINVNAPTG